MLSLWHWGSQMGIDERISVPRNVQGGGQLTCNDGVAAADLHPEGSDPNVARQHLGLAKFCLWGNILILGDLEWLDT